MRAVLIMVALKKVSTFNCFINKRKNKLIKKYIDKDRMNTPTGKKIAQKRHAFMELYLEQFYAEWDGKK